MTTILALIMLLSVNAAALDQDFPSSPPYGSNRGVWCDADGNCFTAYIWWENDYLWLRIMRESGDGPDICSSDFYIIQDDERFDTVELLKEDDRVQCGRVFTSTTFMIKQQDHAYPTADFRDDFTLVYVGDREYRVEITGNRRAADPDGSSSGCFIGTIYH
jgi:hypothetical protein